MKRPVQGANDRRRVTASFHSRRIQTITARMISHGKGKWHRILHHHRIATNVRFPADAAELVYAGISTNVRIVLDGYVTGERRRICHYDAVTKYAIVCDVGLCHERTVVTYLGEHAPASGAAMYCHKFPDQIAPADARFGRLAFVFQILSGQAKGNKRKYPRVLTDYRTTVN